MINEPDFLIIGAQKSATTFIQETISSHPDIYIPKGEVTLIEDISSDEELRAAFKSLYCGKEKHSLFGIKRPNCLPKKEVAFRISKVFPNAKLIATLREPKARAISAYFHYIKYGLIRPLSLNKGMRLIVEGRHPDVAANDILQYGLYGEQLLLYRSYIESNRFLIFLHEEVSDDPDGVVNNIWDFLGVKAISPVYPKRRQQAVIYNINRQRFLAGRNKYVHAYNIDRTRLTPNKGFVPFVINGVFAGIDKCLLGPILGNGKPILDEDLLIRLSDYYEGDISLAESIIEKPLDRWR